MPSRVHMPEELGAGAVATLAQHLCFVKQSLRHPQQHILLCVQVPEELVAEAVATWAQHQGNHHTACTALMAAKQWRAAHEELCSHVAPSLMLDHR